MIRCAADALDLSDWIRPGDRLVVGQGTAEPQTLTEALVAQRERLGGVGVFLGATFSATFDPARVDGLRLRGFGAVGSNRRLTKAGLLDVLPCHVSRIAELIESGDIGCEVAMVLVSPPDARGRYGLCMAGDYTPTAVARARVVIAELNHNAPACDTESWLEASDIDVLVETDRPLLELPSAAVTDFERRIARHADAYIPDRATVQLGIGAIPEAIVAQLGNRRDLGVHSGMVGDALVDLAESGALTNAHKELHPGITVTGVLFGTEARLYRYARAGAPRCQTAHR